MQIGIIGAGGKTTALRRLAREAGERCSTLVTTTTHIFPIRPPECRLLLVDPDRASLLAALAQPGAVCAGSSAGQGRLAPLPDSLLSLGLAAARLTLYEGDGSRGLPLKLHAPFEPVLLPGTDLCLIVAGLSALGRPVGEAVHRFALRPEWAAHPETPVGPEELLFCALEAASSSGLPPGRLRVFLNQADTPEGARSGTELARRVQARGLRCRAGSLNRLSGSLWSWLTA